MNNPITMNKKLGHCQRGIPYFLHCPIISNCETNQFMELIHCNTKEKMIYKVGIYTGYSVMVARVLWGWRVSHLTLQRVASFIINSKQPRAIFFSVGMWCNGSTRPLGGCSPSPNLGIPTEEKIVRFSQFESEYPDPSIDSGGISIAAVRLPSKE